MIKCSQGGICLDLIKIRQPDYLILFDNLLHDLPGRSCKMGQKIASQSWDQSCSAGRETSIGALKSKFGISSSRATGGARSEKTIISFRIWLIWSNSKGNNRILWPCAARSSGVTNTEFRSECTNRRFSTRATTLVSTLKGDFWPLKWRLSGRRYSYWY